MDRRCWFRLRRRSDLAPSSPSKHTDFRFCVSMRVMGRGASRHSPQFSLWSLLVVILALDLNALGELNLHTESGQGGLHARQYLSPCPLNTQAPINWPWYASLALERKCSG